MSNVTVSLTTDKNVQIICFECERFERVVAPNVKDESERRVLSESVREFKQEHSQCSNYLQSNSLSQASG
jgi:hypothetical protein